MHRTTILLPQSLKIKVSNKARKMGVSMGEFIRLSIEKSIKDTVLNIKNDPFVRDTNFFTKTKLSDGSIKHDDYIYEKIK